MDEFPHAHHTNSLFDSFLGTRYLLHSCCEDAPGLGQWTWLLHRGPDVLVEREEVGWIIRVLEGDQPFVVDAIRCPHPLFSLVAQEVDIDATARKWRECPPNMHGPTRCAALLRRHPTRLLC